MKLLYSLYNNIEQDTATIFVANNNKHAIYMAKQSINDNPKAVDMDWSLYCLCSFNSTSPSITPFELGSELIWSSDDNDEMEV